MKLEITRLIVPILYATLLAGCGLTRPNGSVAKDTGHRLVRISFRDQTGTFRIRVNREAVGQLQIKDLTNTISGFHLEYGDFVVWESVRNEQGRELSQPEAVSSWWFDQLPRPHPMPRN